MITHFWYTESPVLLLILLLTFGFTFTACTPEPQSAEDLVGQVEEAVTVPATRPLASTATPASTVLPLVVTKTGTAVPTGTFTLMDVATPLPTLTTTQEAEIVSTPSATLVWNNTRPPTGWVKDMAVVSDTDIWVAGQGGYIAHWDGNTWITMTTPVTATLHGLDFISATDGWAVGDGGVILHWNGDTWEVSRPYTPKEPVGSLAFSSLQDVDFISPSDGWAVGYWSYGGGSGGFILHWDGENWQEDNSNPDDMYACSCPLDSITMLATDDAWAVGGSTQNLGTNSSGIFHWDGQRWGLVMTATEAEALLSVDGFAADNIWAVGIKNSSFDMSYIGMVLHWNGEEWKEVFLPYPAQKGWLSSILMLSEDEGWVAGDINRVSYWDGKEWQVIENRFTPSIAKVAASPSGKVFGITGKGELLLLAPEGVQPWPGNN